MTHKLQQAIRLLQLSSVELQTEIQDALESNMMLELAEEEIEGSQSNGDSLSERIEITQETIDVKDSLKANNIPDYLLVDSAWEDTFDSNFSHAKQSESFDFTNIESQNSSEKTLRDHLLWQLNLTPISEVDTVIATAIIDELDDDGYLSCESEDILAMLEDDIKVETDEIDAVIHMVQALEPVGVAARDLQECLRLQLAQYQSDTPGLKKAKVLVDKHLQLLASHDYNQLMRRLKLNQEKLVEVISLIRSLNPRPGSQVKDSHIQYITPDAYVKKVKGVWKVDLNSDSLPQLRVNSNYARMIRRADNSSDNSSLKSHLQEAKWFIKSLRNRSDTLLRVAISIVEHQRAFMEYGEEAMKPLILHDIAEALSMHESTISRATTCKYLHTPRGIFELKYFFSSHVNTDSRGACSSTAIKALIKKLITAEEPQKPLSDSKIATLLEDQGIRVARRTIAKYREVMTISPSNKRKRLA